jgi:type I restriction enzyme S subunit
LEEKRSTLITQAVTKGLNSNVPMKDSGIDWLGQIPDHWHTAFLDKIVDSTRRVTYGIVQPGEPDPNGIFMVRGQNYSFGWSEPSEIFRVSPEIEAAYSRARLKAGDIVMTIVGAGTGNIAVVPNWLDGANITQTTARVTIDKKYGINRYFAYLLQSAVGVTNVEQSVKGAAQPGLNLTHLVKFRMLIPPISEQERIANHLDDSTKLIDDVIVISKQKIEKLKEYQTALISAAVTGKIDVRGQA